MTKGPIDLKAMPFASEEERAAFAAYLGGDNVAALSARPAAAPASTRGTLELRAMPFASDAEREAFAAYLREKLPAGVNATAIGSSALSARAVGLAMLAAARERGAVGPARSVAEGGK
jgi:hypothetical protein